MEDYSIESAYERINDPKTREYFREVFSSYINGNFRSALVMLWSVVICDLIHKLHYLRDIHNDSTALSILEIIMQKQKQNPKSPDWEMELIKQIKERTELLDTDEYLNLQHLQENRHLSAHPIIGTTDLLFSPNKETTRAFIRNAIDGVLLKPPILTRKVVDVFVDDLAIQKDVLLDDDSLKRYIEARYLKNLRSSTWNHLFRALWKFVFQLSNEDTNKNREINFRALKIIYSYRQSEFRKYITNNQETFSSNVTRESFPYLIRFLSDNPSVYALLSDTARVLIENYAKIDVNLFAVAFFLSDDIKSHMDQVSQKIKNSSTTLEKEAGDRLFQIARDNSCESLIIDLIVQLYINSRNFNSADETFARFVYPYLDNLSESHLKILLSGIENNNQTYWRSRAAEDHKKIKKRCDAVFGTSFNYSIYPYFIKSLNP